MSNLFQWEKDSEPLDREQVKNIAENQQLYQRVFGSTEGKKVLEDLAKRCYEKYTTYDDIPHKMAFKEGRRSVYKHIENMLEKDLQSILEELTKD